MRKSQVIRLLDNVNGTIRYGRVAERFGRNPRQNGQAVGAIMRSICLINGRHDLCIKVVGPDGRHRCKHIQG